ncbi:MAG: CHAD domain-containing protein [Steroidobacterales bacterium]
MSARNPRADRSATAAVCRAALHHAANAARSLGAQRPSDVDVHAARKQIKKSRAALRLLRAALGGATYRREDAALRTAARALNAVRDARVLARTLDALRRRRVGLGNDKTVAAMARVLRRHQVQVRQQLRLRPELLAGARSTLQQVQRRALRWRVRQLGWSGLEPAFRRIYRAGRRAAHAAKGHPDIVTLHEWRKKVQYLWHALQILKPLQSRALPKVGALARGLVDYLGEEHDLALLHAAALTFARRHGPVSEALLAAMERRRRSLRRKSMGIGKRLYAQKSRPLAARVRRCFASPRL